MELTVTIWDKKSAINGFTAEKILGMPTFGWAKEATVVLTKRGDQVLRIDDSTILRSNNNWPDDISDVQLCGLYLEQQQKEDNPDALLSDLEIRRKAVLQAIAERDKASDVFYIQFGTNVNAPRYQMWLDKITRGTLLSEAFPAAIAEGKDIVSLWTDTTPRVEFFINPNWGTTNLLRVGSYAGITYGLRMENENKAYVAQTDEELNDVMAHIGDSYPEPIVAVLDIASLPANIQQYYAQLLQNL